MQIQPGDRGRHRPRFTHIRWHQYRIEFNPRTRAIPLGEKTIAGWYSAWRKDGIDALSPRPRRGQGQSKLAAEIQEANLRLKQEHPRRSLLQILQVLESTGQVSRGMVSRSAIHRLLQRHGLSQSTGAASEPGEKRSFVAACQDEVIQVVNAHGSFFRRWSYGPTATPLAA
ncbi:helix-turn-helix domain-containing protein [Acidithiobacillus ferridurans]|uniref:helix-turn-helix domain-containing protein n=1 Tax=Acidithiobacillus ferridurans TaxID=1232575 RepID=UPI001C077CBB|nr:helix-turn-helix domain-containing protein [Acidithiobacillus ferridurans]MBU2803972.1 helix-turn-helix domain-containing protein [Acidithiobacillus ferridurans]